MKYWAWYWLFCIGWGLGLGMAIRGYEPQAFAISLVTCIPLGMSYRDAIRHES